LETYLAYAPRGIQSFIKSMPLWVKQKLWIKELIANDVGYKGKILFLSTMNPCSLSIFPFTVSGSAF
jgi:hypothetical protein